MFLSKVKTATRLETMIVKLFNKKTGKYETVRVFLDRGSNISVISKKCATRCGLDVHGVDNMFISSFGHAAKKCKMKRTKIDFFENSEKLDGHLPVGAYIMDSLMSDIVSYKLSERQRNF